jgi:hypothetical protein
VDHGAPHSNVNKETKVALEFPFKEQLRRNAVALISLFVAVSSLSYNTWRNEESEHNRNQRLGAFEILDKVGEFEQVVWNIHYDMSDFGGTPRTGWALVRTINDIAIIMDAPIPEKAESLKAVWALHEAGLGEQDASVEAIKAAAEELRYAARMQLQALD